jgi:hypothetical protein
MPTQRLPAASLRTANRLPAVRVPLGIANSLICRAVWPFRTAIFGVDSIFLPALSESARDGYICAAAGTGQLWLKCRWLLSSTSALITAGPVGSDGRTLKLKLGSSLMAMSDSSRNTS